MIKLGTYEPEFDTYSDRAVNVRKDYLDLYVYPGRKYKVTTLMGTYDLRAVEYRDLAGLTTVGFWIPIFGIVTIRFNVHSNMIQNIE